MWSLASYSWGSRLPFSVRRTLETGESSTAEKLRSAQYVVTGTLERRQERYALVNDDGVLEAYVIPRKSLELSRYVGQFVELTVREPILPSNGEPKLWVDRVSLPARDCPRPACAGVPSE